MKKSKVPKDEAVRYAIAKELERQGSDVSDYKKYKEIEWRYCETCKKVVEPTPSQKFLMIKAKLARNLNPKIKPQLLAFRLPFLFIFIISFITYRPCTNFY